MHFPARPWFFAALGLTIAACNDGQLADDAGRSADDGGLSSDVERDGAADDAPELRNDAGDASLTDAASDAPPIDAASAAAYVVYRATIQGEDALWATRADQPGTAHRLSPPSEERQTPILRRTVQVPGRALIFDTLDTTYVTQLSDLTTRPLLGQGVRAQSLEISSSGTHVVAQRAPWGEAFLVDLRTSGASAVNLGSQSDVFTPDGTGLLLRGPLSGPTGTSTGLTFLDLTTNVRTDLLSGQAGLSFYHTPQGRFVVITTENGRVFVFDRTQPAKLREVEIPGRLWFAVAGATSTQLHLMAQVNLETHAEWVTVSLPDGVPVVREAPDEAIGVSVCGDRVLQYRNSTGVTTLFDDREPGVQLTLPEGYSLMADCDHVFAEGIAREVVSPLGLGKQYKTWANVSKGWRYSYRYDSTADAIVVSSTATGAPIFVGPDSHGEFGFFSPDETHFFYARDFSNGHVEIVSVALDGDTTVTTPPVVEAIVAPTDLDPQQEDLLISSDPGYGMWWNLASDGETLVFPARPSLGDDRPAGVIALRRSSGQQVRLVEALPFITHLEVLGSTATGLLTFSMSDRFSLPRPYSVDVHSGKVGIPQLPQAPYVRAMRLSRDGQAVLAWNEGQFWIESIHTEPSDQPPVLGPVTATLSDAVGGMGPYGFLLHADEAEGVWSRVDAQGLLSEQPHLLTGTPRWLADGRAVYADQESEPGQLFVLPVHGQNGPAAAAVVPLPEGTSALLDLAPQTARAWLRVGGAQAGIYAMHLDPSRPWTKLSDSFEAAVWVSLGGESAAALSPAAQLTVLRAGEQDPVEVTVEGPVPSEFGAALRDDGKVLLYHETRISAFAPEYVVKLDTTDPAATRRFEISREGSSYGQASGFGSSFIFSSDGRYALRLKDDGSGFRKHHLLDLEGGTVTRLGVEPVQFDPAGRYLLYGPSRLEPDGALGLLIADPHAPMTTTRVLPAGAIFHVPPYRPRGQTGFDWVR